MELTELTVSIGRTYNLGNFESLRLDASARATVAEGEDPDNVRSTLNRHCLRSIETAYAAAKGK